MTAEARPANYMNMTEPNSLLKQVTRFATAVGVAAVMLVPSVGIARADQPADKVPDFICTPPADSTEYPPGYSTIVLGGNEVGVYRQAKWDCTPINPANP